MIQLCARCHAQEKNSTQFESTSTTSNFDFKVLAYYCGSNLFGSP
jgi:hypothetical protein